MLYTARHNFDVCCPECRQNCTEADIRPLVTFCTSANLYKVARPILLESVASSNPDHEEQRPILVVPDCSVADGPAGCELKVPPMLHMNSLTATQLRKRLHDLNISTEGSKQDLIQRYKKFRSIVQTEKDKGGRSSIEELAKKFQKPASAKRSAMPRKLDGFFENKTHLDLINEIKKRKKQHDGTVEAPE